jgi:hypothetical protein
MLLLDKNSGENRCYRDISPTCMIYVLQIEGRKKNIVSLGEI